jgi:uncharacterized protein YjlB
MDRSCLRRFRLRSCWQAESIWPHDLVHYHSRVRGAVGVARCFAKVELGGDRLTGLNVVACSYRQRRQKGVGLFQ